MENHEVKSVMHAERLRTLQVKKIQRVSPHIQRVTLSGRDLKGFKSLAPDDYISVYFRKSLVKSLAPPSADAQDSVRNYTLRRFDPESQELDIDFVLHGEGPGTEWAASAQIGDSLDISGPRLSKVISYDFNWYLLIGDETAASSFARRLEDLPEKARAIVVFEVENESCKLDFTSKANLEVHWVYRGSQPAGECTLLKQKLNNLEFPEGDFFTWIFAEKSCVQNLKAVLVDSKGAKEKWVQATGYWSRKKKIS